MLSHLSLPYPVIVGDGLAGLYLALSASPMPVLLISSSEEGSSWKAQGGMAAALAPNDNPSHHAKDTINASSGLTHSEIVKEVTEKGPAIIQRLADFGVQFDRDDTTGCYALGREAAHSRARIVHGKGDTTGKMIVGCLKEAALLSPSIQYIHHARATRLIEEKGRVTGLEIETGAGRTRIECPSVILATGGYGGLYRYSTNPEGLIGSGHALAWEVGALLRDMEFVQFHPTAIALQDDQNGPCPLATEALRGAGAKLINDNGLAFMEPIHVDAELAPRDIVARAVFHQLQQGLNPALDCTKAVGRDFEDKFPTVFKLCMERGLNPAENPIPVRPAAHYCMGGILVNKHSASSIPGLYAIGECASTGLHGANRLASNSLLEACAMADNLIKDLKDTIPYWGGIPSSYAGPLLDNHVPLAAIHYDLALKSDLYKHLGLIRDQDGMQAMQLALLKPTPKDRTVEMMKIVATSITQSAFNRKESRGAHYRSDFPKGNSAYALHSLSHRDHRLTQAA